MPQLAIQVCLDRHRSDDGLPLGRSPHGRTCLDALPNQVTLIKQSVSHIWGQSAVQSCLGFSAVRECRSLAWVAQAAAAASQRRLIRPKHINSKMDWRA